MLKGETSLFSIIHVKIYTLLVPEYCFTIELK